jgi:hypothetical protein
VTKNLASLLTPSTPRTSGPALVVRGRVLAAPGGDGILRVSVPRFDSEDLYEVPPGHWMSRGDAAPQARAA